MNPSELGLPSKFEGFRDGQLEIAAELSSADKRFVLLSAPTGSGKTIIYMTLARLLEARTLVLVGTKGLQDQIVADFDEMGVVDQRGQGNYPCLALEDGGEMYGTAPLSMCDRGPCKVGVECGLKERGCEYFDAQRRSRQAQVVVTNYAYWLALGAWSDPAALGQFDLLVLDEAHNAPDWVTRSASAEVGRREVQELDVDAPSIEDPVMDWSRWAARASVVCKRVYGAATSAEEKLRLQGLGRRLARIVAAGGSQDGWIVERWHGGARLVPVWPRGYCEKLLFRSIPRVVLTSATVTSQTAGYLGLRKKDFDYTEVDSAFSKERRPFVFVTAQPEVRVDRRMTEGHKRIWARRIDEIIAGRMDRKGIIHTRSYRRAQELVERSRFADSMIVPRDGRDTQPMVERFRSSSAPAILVSAALEEGYDFPYDECRYQVIAKVPFLDSRGPLTKARSELDSDYLNYEAAQDLIQMAGRGMRAEDDLCETFIVDGHWKWFSRTATFPGWFKRAWKRKKGIPEPPRLVDG